MRHLTHLNYIDVVAKEKSIRKAAEKLSITSTALNRRIIALGGINFKNLRRIKLTKSKGVASISWIKKNGLK